MAMTDRWTWRGFVTPATVLIIGVIFGTFFACELRGIEARLTSLDSKIVSVDAKIDHRGEAVEQQEHSVSNMRETWP